MTGADGRQVPQYLNALASPPSVAGEPGTSFALHSRQLRDPRRDHADYTFDRLTVARRHTFSGVYLELVDSRLLATA